MNDHFNAIASPSGTRLDFNILECGECVVEANVHDPRKSGERRIRLEFSGVACVRINDSCDQRSHGRYLLNEIVDSSWRKDCLSEYIQEFGDGLLPIVEPLRHFIVFGHELRIAFLARKVEQVA